MTGSGWTLVGFDDAYDRWARTTTADEATRRQVRAWLDCLARNHQPPGIVPPRPGQTYLADPEDPDDPGTFEDCFNGFIWGLPAFVPLRVGYDVDFHADTITCRYLFEHRQPYRD